MTSQDIATASNNVKKKGKTNKKKDKELRTKQAQ